jgi:hypothetical protein
LKPVTRFTSLLNSQFEVISVGFWNLLIDRASSVDDGGSEILFRVGVIVFSDRDADKLMGCAVVVEPVKDKFGKSGPVTIVCGQFLDVMLLTLNGRRVEEHLILLMANGLGALLE